MIGGRDALSWISQGMSFAESGGAGAVWSEVDWLKTVELANAHFLAATLYLRLCESGRDGALPGEARSYLALLLERNAERNAALREQAREILGAFEAAGIPPLLLKGAITLFDRGDPLRHSRMMRDLDILVPRRSERAAAAILRDLGYRVGTRYPPGHHAYGEFQRDGAQGAVDLHTELVDPAYILPASEVWRGSRPLSGETSPAWAPAPSERMLHHLLHAQIHHRGQYYRGELRLDQLFDCAAIARRFAGEIDWEYIEARLRAHRLGTPLQSYLLAAERIFGLAWPLAEAPGSAARLHVNRCILQLRHPAFGRPLKPLANLRGALAWHRMRALYGEDAATAGGPLRHLYAYLRKTSLREALERVLR